MTRLISLIVTETGLSADDVHRIIRTAPQRYKVFEIQKRTGGMREIAQPAREVKLLQRILLERFLINLPVHDAAKAYRTGLSIRDNAAPHAGNGPILKMDFQNFFPSIRSHDWLDYCKTNNVFEAEDRLLSSMILFRKAKREQLLKLSIGAPSSPMVSNILMHSFDALVAAEADRKKIVYTRYADDLTFSGQRIGMLKDMIEFVHDTTRQMNSPKLTVNTEKTTFVTAKTRRVVTGVTLSNSGQLSLGHDRKRLLSAQIHHAIRGKLNVDELKMLIGYLAFAKVVEPSFLDRMYKKYGFEQIRRLKVMAKQ
jgi:hypothetical protein